MKFEINNGTLTLFPEGQITSVNAQEWEKDAFQTLENQSYSTLVLNFGSVPYVSSAGLRAILKLRKANPAFSVVDLTPEVWDVFTMTGFNEMMECHRMLRRISIDGAELIGEGAVGRVYRIDTDTIVKVYKHGTPEEIKQEMDVARRAFRLGVPTAIPYDLVLVGDAYGTVYEMLGSDCPRALISGGDERLDFVVEKYAALLHDLHAVSDGGEGFEDAKLFFLSFLENAASVLFTDAEREKMIALIRSVPDADTLVHNDLHLGNVLSIGGDWMIIDLDGMTKGHPVFDFGAIFATYYAFFEKDHAGMEDFHRIPWDVAMRMRHDLLRRYYDGISEEKAAEIERIVAFIGYLRLLGFLIARPGFSADLPNVANAVEKLKAMLPGLSTLAYQL